MFANQPMIEKQRSVKTLFDHDTCRTVIPKDTPKAKSGASTAPKRAAKAKPVAKAKAVSEPPPTPKRGAAPKAPAPKRQRKS